MRNLITRTFNTLSVSCLVYSDGKLTASVVFVPVGFNTEEQAERYIRKNNLVSGKLVSVEKIEKLSATYGMTESDFIANAKPFDARSKETRNLVTKNVTAFVGDLLYMTSDRKIVSVPVTVPKEFTKKVDTYAVKVASQFGGKGITIENVHSVTSLFGMTEQDFINIGKPMIDNQHFIVE